MPEDFYWQQYASRFRTYAQEVPPPDVVPDMIVCIPVYAEPALMRTLDSLLVCDIPDARIEVMLLYNQSNRMTHDELAVHVQSWEDLIQWMNMHQESQLRFIPIRVDDMPDPKGGVGWARKLVMDEAARRLNQDGVILCLDADCEVASNYLAAVQGHFAGNPECDAASVYFEHPLDAMVSGHRQAIVEYELHLRYLVQAMRWAGHPFAFHTVGSAMAVRRRTYLAQGGMNTRQAGEDFYFLQKCIEAGPFSEITSTTVCPSPRLSSRVPFGTGRAMLKMQHDGIEWYTTNVEVFRCIKPLFADIDKLYELAVNELNELEVMGGIFMSDQGLRKFLNEINFYQQVTSIRRHTKSPSGFRKRFFRYFNAFMMIRYMHFMRQEGYPDVPVELAAHQLSGFLEVSISLHASSHLLLDIYRSLDRIPHGK